jgi:prenylcysteine alpha-carboxyl methylesterase
MHVLKRILRWMFYVPFLFRNILFHALNVVSLVTRLYYYVSRGTRLWVVMFSRLLIYTVVLLPGWLHMCFYWLFSPLVVRNVEYGLGQRFRNVLDIYLPVNYHNPRTRLRGRSYNNTTYPVIILVSGGAWIIGYKLWSCLVGRALSILGFITIVPDYRNFPQGSNDEMMDDVKAAVFWCVDNIHR